MCLEGAGECPATPAPEVDALARAHAFLSQRTCAVFVSERPEESASYLSRVLGLDGSTLGSTGKGGRRMPTPLRSENTFAAMAAKRNTPTHASRTAAGWDVPAHIAGGFSERNDADAQLHGAMLRRLDKQVAALRKVKSGPGRLGTSGSESSKASAA
jgi:hypothetical protein